MMSLAESKQAATAQLARASLRYLAERQLPPTPDAYRRAWQSVGGTAETAESVSEDRRGAPVALGPLMYDAMRLLEVSHRNWTRARKKDALGRVLGNQSVDAARMAERLEALLAKWRNDAADLPAETEGTSEADAGTTHEGTTHEGTTQSANAVRADAGTMCGAQHVDRSRRMLAEMTRLLVAVCDAVPRLVEEEAWVRRQFDAIRGTLDAQAGLPDRRDLAQARDVLLRTADEHQRLLALRRDSLQMMKSMIAQCIEWLRMLTESSDRYGGKLASYMEQIQNSPDITALAGAVHDLIEETRAVYSEFDAKKQDFASAGARARQLQDEVNRLALQLDSASTQIMTDHLTRLLNRRGLEKSFENLQADCRSSGRALSIGLLDVDDFKKLNDALGHQAGDEALRHLASLMRAQMRPSDLCARYGGEEFVVVLPGSHAREAADVVRRLQRALTTEVFLHRSEQVFVTFSAGVARVRIDESFAQAIARADDAMYRAKHNGKNRVCIAEDGDD